MHALALILFLAQDGKLDQRITFEHRGGLTRGLSALQEKLGLPIDLDPGVAGKLDVEREIALSLRDVRGDSALTWIARLYGLTWSARGGRVVLTLPDGLETKVLDLRGIFRRGHGDATPRVDTAEGLGGVTVTLLEPRESITASDAIVDLVTETIEPGSWEGACAIEVLWDERMIVTHAPAVVRKVESLLEVLRRAKAATVSIEADLFEATVDVSTLQDVQLRDLVRKDPRARSFSIPCTEGETAYAMVMGQRVAVQNVPNDEIVSLYTEAAVLSVLPAVSTDGSRVRVKLWLQAGRATPHIAEMLGGTIDLPEASLVRMETLLELANGGSTVLLLPRRGRGSERPQALWVRVKAGARGPVGSVEGAEEGAQALWAKLDAIAPMDLSIRDTRVEEVAAFLRQSTGLNFVVDPQVDPHLKLTHQAKQTRLRPAIEQLLSPHGLEIVPIAEAFLIGPASADGVLRVYVESLRDLECPAFDARIGNEEGSKCTFTGDDMADLIQNLIAKDEWDDDRVIQQVDGFLIVRQRPSVMAEIRAFLERLRAARERGVRMRVDLLDLPAEKADVEGFLAPGDADKLVALATSREHVTLRGAEGSRLGLDWTRQISYVRDCEEAEGSIRTIQDTMSAPTTLWARAATGADGATVELSLKENAIDDIPLKKFGKFELHAPVMGMHHATTTFTIPKGKVAVLKLSGSRDGEAERTVRVMLVRVE